MNRLHAAALLADHNSIVPIHEIPNVQTHAETAPSGCAVFAPLHYEPKYAYPLLVWLHGRDNDENQLKRVMPLISMRNYAAIAPRGTDSAAVDRSDQSDWPGSSSAASPRRFRWSQREDHIHQAENRILAAVQQACGQFHINPRRIFLIGAGCGGTMAFRVAMRHPDRFRGVLSLGGAFPTGKTPLARLLDARHLPLFVSSARGCCSYPEQQVCDNLRLFHTAGLSITLRQYPGDQPLHEAVFSDIDHWIMQVLAGDHEASVVSA